MRIMLPPTILEEILFICDYSNTGIPQILPFMDEIRATYLAHQSLEITLPQLEALFAYTNSQVQNVELGARIAFCYSDIRDFLASVFDQATALGNAS